MVFFAAQKHFSLTWSDEVFAFMALSFGVKSKIISITYVKELTVFFFFFKFLGVLSFPRSFFQILHLKRTVHSKLIFVHGVGQGSTFILLQVAVHFSQHHLLRRLSFSPWYVCRRLIDPMCVGLFLGSFSVPLICVYVFLPVLNCSDDCTESFVVSSEVRELESSSSVLSQDGFGYLSVYVSVQVLR